MQSDFYVQLCKWVCYWTYIINHDKNGRILMRQILVSGAWAIPYCNLWKKENLLSEPHCQPNFLPGQFFGKTSWNLGRAQWSYRGYQRWGMQGMVPRGPCADHLWVLCKAGLAIYIDRNFPKASECYNYGG